MSESEQAALAALLLKKARADLAAAQALVASEDDHHEAIGFHAQQAVEKAIKAVLTAHEIGFPRTHDLAFLIELTSAAGIAMAASVADGDWLTPWAVSTRYDDLDEPLDTDAAPTVAESAVGWAMRF